MLAAKNLTTMSTDTFGRLYEKACTKPSSITISTFCDSHIITRCLLCYAHRHRLLKPRFKLINTVCIEINDNNNNTNNNIHNHKQSKQMGNFLLAYSSSSEMRKGFSPYSNLTCLLFSEKVRKWERWIFHLIMFWKYWLVFVKAIHRIMILRKDREIKIVII